MYFSKVVNLTYKCVNTQLQYAPSTRGQRLPSSLISKGFTFSHGKISLEVTLDREIYYHGEKVIATLVISNSSRKSVKNIKVRQIYLNMITINSY